MATRARGGDRLEHLAAVAGVPGAARERAHVDASSRPFVVTGGTLGLPMRARIVVALSCLGAFVVPPLHVAVAAEDPATVKPTIVWKKIAFNARRKRQMARYSLEHYGKRTYVLNHPHVVIEHYTDSRSFDSA